jgi:putative ABC transport system ATP-binding protein
VRAHHDRLEERPDERSVPGSVIAARLVGASRYYRVGDQRTTALDRVTIDFAANRFTTVIGPSGSGKSTLLHCLAGLVRLSSGCAYLGDVELGGLGARQLRRVRRQQVGVIFQGLNLHPGFNVADNLALPSLIMRRKPDPDWFDEVVSRLGLGDRLRRRPHELSRGEQQRVAAARALIGRPAIILADEPTGNLDQRNGRQLVQTLRIAVDQFAQTVVMASHDPTVAAEGDTVLRLIDGRLDGRLDAPTSSQIIEMMSLGSHPVQGGGAGGGGGE